MRKVVRVLACMFLVAGLMACGQDTGDDDPNGARARVPSLAPPLATPTTTQSPEPLSTSTASVPPGATSPTDAAEGLFATWQAGDSDAALDFGTPEAVAELFGSPPGDAEFHGCEPEGPGADERFRCSYRYEGGGLHMIVEARDAGIFQVADILFVAD